MIMNNQKMRYFSNPIFQLLWKIGYWSLEIVVALIQQMRQSPLISLCDKPIERNFKLKSQDQFGITSEISTLTIQMSIKFSNKMHFHLARTTNLLSRCPNCNGKCLTSWENSKWGNFLKDQVFSTCKDPQSLWNAWLNERPKSMNLQG